MKIGVIGCGKLGLPVALAIDYKGHEVKVNDINPNIEKYLTNRSIPFKEVGAKQLLESHNIKTANLEELVEWADIIFCAIQTPHEKAFEGTTRLPNKRKDFNYSYLLKAISDIAEAAKAARKQTSLVVISTCLPGTFESTIKPLLNDYIDYLYNPFFIAMGTTIMDYLNPEFVLIGSENHDKNTEDESIKKLWRFYGTIHQRQLFITDTTTAEAIKVSYNTFITMKTVLGNTWGEIAHKIGANVDDIYTAWSLASDRLISPKYLKAGMGDGGGCHPRDNIALSWLATEIGLSHNLFEDLMRSREDHAEWLTSLLPDGVVIFGRAFKPETNIETGSPAILVANILKEQGKTFIHEEDPTPGKVNFIATAHERYRGIEWPKGSKVIDPFGIIPDQTGVDVIRLGRI